MGFFLWHLLSFGQVLKHLGKLKKHGVRTDIWSRIPFPEGVRKAFEYLFIYPESLNKTDLSKEDRFVFHFIWNILIPLACLWKGLKEPRDCFIYACVFVGAWLGKYSLLHSYKLRRVRIFNKNAYQLYKFLHNQLSAGVQPKESMMSLHRIVQDTFFKERLQALGSMYAQTLDFDLSFEEIAAYYEGPEVDAFKIAMVQGISLGNNLNTLKKQEELMFSKYMTYLQIETERQKVKTFVVVTLFCFIIIFMIGLPLWMELQQALELIFIK
jgi:hypothetical protein